MKKDKKLDFIFLKSNQDKEKSKVIIAFHGWRGNKSSFLPMAKNSAFQEFNWYLPEAPYLVDNDNNQRSWSYEIEEGILKFMKVLRSVPQFSNIEFEKEDIVRSSLVKSYIISKLENGIYT